MDAIMFVIKVLVTLALFFGMVIGMAVCNGILSGLWQDTDRAREGQVMWRGRAGFSIREYKRLNPGGRKHMQAYLAGAIGFIFLFALTGWLLFLAWS